MKITDAVYGGEEITAPVLVELINCPAIQRLRHIDQGGLSRVWFAGGEHNRYQHSLGVCILLKRYGASVSEQAAGLIHDVSHTVFSHCADYALAQGSEARQSFQDDVFHTLVLETDIPDILERHGLDPEYIFDESNFPLQETELPDLCADRIDYILRCAYHYEKTDISVLRGHLENLCVKNLKWCFKDFNSAKAFAELFNYINDKHLSGLKSASMFRTVGDVLKYCLGEGYLSMDDLFATDDLVLDKIEDKAAKDPELAKLWKRMNNKTEVRTGTGECGARVVCKSRVVDPLFIDNGGLKRVSEVDKDFAAGLAQGMKPKSYCLVFVDE